MTEIQGDLNQPPREERPIASKWQRFVRVGLVVVGLGILPCILYLFWNLRFVFFVSAMIGDAVSETKTAPDGELYVAMTDIDAAYYDSNTETPVLKGTHVFLERTVDERVRALRFDDPLLIEMPRANLRSAAEMINELTQFILESEDESKSGDISTGNATSVLDIMDDRLYRAFAYDYRAHLRDSIGQVKEAISDYNNALDLHPCQIIRHHLAMCQREHGNRWAYAELRERDATIKNAMVLSWDDERYLEKYSEWRRMFFTRVRDATATGSTDLPRN